MQLTRFDHWLKERFIYETHIFTLRLPEEGFGPGVEIQEFEQKKGGDYRHRLIIKDNKRAEEVIAQLRKGHIMHATHIFEGKNWYNRHLAPKDGKSFTFQWIIRSIGVMLTCCGAWGVYLLTQNESLVSTIKATIEDLKGGM
ncbi:MAG: hypothetical protein KJO21_01365 [Verrucomicrobiae bacterium]|nr:hypothetical protein [Verrucomicrobiae bacterium]NNJ42183.1 hypothetical protein [Akkermansiaceae bacterium]